LPGLRSGVIESHFKKIFSYDAGGLENNYILVYAESDDFMGLWRKYLEFLPSVEIKYEMREEIKVWKTQYTDIKAARTVHNRHDRETSVYHIFVNMKI
jgi:hypothetical protein